MFVMPLGALEHVWNNQLSSGIFRPLVTTSADAWNVDYVLSRNSVEAKKFHSLL